MKNFILFTALLTISELHAFDWSNIPTNIPTAPGTPSEYGGMTREELIALKDQLNTELRQYNNMLGIYMNQQYRAQYPELSKQQIADTQQQIRDLHAKTQSIDAQFNAGTYRQ